MRPPTELEIGNWKRFHSLFSTAFIHEALGAVAELEIADCVSENFSSIRDIAKSRHLHEGSVYRVLRALAAYGIFEEGADGAFRHNSFSLQLKKSHPYSMHGMALLWHAEPMRKAWGHFSSALQDGNSAFSHANKASIYSYLEEHPELAERFHHGMENNSAIVSRSIAQGYPFSDYGSVIDLAGGRGTLLASILEEHPISGAVFDLPQVKRTACSFLDERGLGSRAKFLEGDWFESVPSGFDLYMIKNSLWNWTDAQCSKILENISYAIPKQSRLLLIEYIPRPSDAPWSTAFDLQQLNITGGRGRTVEEYRELLASHRLKVSSSFGIENQHVLECRLS